MGHGTRLHETGNATPHAARFFATMNGILQTCCQPADAAIIYTDTTPAHAQQRYPQACMYSERLLAGIDADKGCRQVTLGEG